MVATVNETDVGFSPKISALLSAPTFPQLRVYFEALLGDRGCPGLEVKLDAPHGKGVYCKVNFQEGDLILKDKMLVGAQHCSNKFDCLVCSFCFQFIGSVELQIGRKLYLQGLDASVSDESGCNSSLSKTRIPSDVVQSLMDGSMKLPFTSKFALPPVVSCPGGCREAFYCSELCAEADWNAFHSLLCTGSSSQDKKALLEFLKHANETNDIFIPAAKLISCILLRYRELKASHIEKQREKKDSTLQDDGTFPLLLEAWKPVSMGYKKKWWDCISLPEDVDPCEESQFRMEIKELARESLQLLREAIYDDECAPLFSLDIYGHIIGMFELNNLDLVVASPVEDYFLYIDELPHSEREEAEKITEPLLDALGNESYSAPCQGTAFFPLQSCMNHSCVPNAKAFKREEDRDGQATIIAARPISAGEEITISYIDEDLPYNERQRLLADYGFHCKCPKCLEDRK